MMQPVERHTSETWDETWKPGKPGDRRDVFQFFQSERLSFGSVRRVEHRMLTGCRIPCGFQGCETWETWGQTGRFPVFPIWAFIVRIG